MKKVGILVGREQSFPESLINSINEKGKGDVVAEMIKVGGIRLDEPKRYDVIVDRISHEVPYYRAMLKRIALEGTYVINDPFWWSADDKFFNYSLAAKLGVAVPKTVLLPQHSYIKDITSESYAIWNSQSTGKELLITLGFPLFLNHTMEAAGKMFLRFTLSSSSGLNITRPELSVWCCRKRSNTISLSDAIASDKKRF